VSRRIDPPSAEVLGVAFRAAVDDILATVLAERREALQAIDPAAMVLADLARAALAAGKRLRPAFLWWGYRAASDTITDSAALLRAATSLELLHAGLLVHDDVIDQADTRHGEPAMHVRFAEEHRAAGATGSADRYGQAGAVLLGASLLCWSEDLFETCGLPDDARCAARPFFQAARAEVLAGQFLDLRLQHDLPTGAQDGTPPQATVIAYKTASYTVTRPCQIGAALGGGSPALVAGLAQFGAHLGAAFQLRDDVLDVFGDPACTGKASGGDLREGKPTVLMAWAKAHATPAQAAALRAAFGVSRASDHDIAAASTVLAETGALAHVEATIRREHEQALDALARTGMTSAGRAGLAELARLCVDRAG